MPSLKEYLLNFNTFEPDPDSNEREDEHQRRSNIIATRVYFIVFILVLIILTLFLLFNQQTLLITIENPTEDQVKTLPEDAQCPCSRILIEYGEFVSSEPYFHQVCSSDFISDRWIETIFSGANSTTFFLTDFRVASSAQFQALASLCRLSKVNALQGITSFAMNTFISPKALLDSDLQREVQESVDQFQSTTNKTFGTQLKQLRELTMAFNLLSGLQTNYLPYYLDFSGSGYMDVYIGPRGYTYDNGTGCECGRNIDCQSSANFYNLSGPATTMGGYGPEHYWLMQIPGFSVGCLPVDSILLSTLECFYNQTCIDGLVSYFSTTENFTAMTKGINSHFAINATVKSIVDWLMVEEWRRNISYEKYYTLCAPISCTYLAKTQSSFVFVLTKIISLLGGLTVALRLMIPTVIRFIRQPRNTEPTPEIPRK